MRLSLPNRLDRPMLTRTYTDHNSSTKSMRLSNKSKLGEIRWISNLSSRRPCKQHWCLCQLLELIHVYLQPLWITARAWRPVSSNSTSWSGGPASHGEFHHMLLSLDAGKLSPLSMHLRKFIAAAVVTRRLSVRVDATVVGCVLLLSCQPLCVNWICCL